MLLSPDMFPVAIDPEPTAILLVPVVRLFKATSPIAMLLSPAVNPCSVSYPNAMLLSPVDKLFNALRPIPILANALVEV